VRPLSDTDPTIIGSYRLIGVLGNGGMGRVYMGQSRSGRPVAIKVIRPDLVDDPVFRRRFAREVEAVRSVNPLFTAAVIDADTSAPAPWLATTYIEGPSLERWVDEHGPLSPGAVLTLAAGLAEALASIHAAGLVHRDLKPSNVLLGDVGPYIIDFGVVLSPNATRVTSSLVVGTPSYLAPERIHGGEANPATDVFALGATLVYAATGRTLVDDSDTVYAQMMRIIKGKFDLGDVPAELRPMITRCLSAEARERPTAVELSQMLFAAGVSTPEPGWHQEISDVPFSAVLTPPARRATSRRRLLVGGGLIGLATVGGTAVGLLVYASGQERGDAASGPPKPGTLLWQGRSGAQPIPDGPPGGPDGPGAGGPSSGGPSGGGPGGGGGPDNQSQRVWVVPLRSRLMVAATRSGVEANGVDGKRHWTWTLPLGPVALLRWDDAVLVAGRRGLIRLDLTTGEELKRADAGPVQRVAVAGERVFAGGPPGGPGSGGPGNLVAYSRDLVEQWRVDGGGTPLAADSSWVFTHDRVGTDVRVALYAAGTRERQWIVQFPAPAVVTEAEGGPPGPPPDEPGGPPRTGRDDRRPGPPPYDDNWNRTEALLGDGFVVLRDASDLRALRLADGTQLWKYTAPRPVTDVALTGDLLVLAADRVSARRARTNEAVWQAPPGGARVVIADGRHVVAAAPDGQVWARDLAGIELWATELPDRVRPGLPERLFVDGDQVLVTLGPPPNTQLESDTVDVVALKL
jgi:predicted Ser/Thr protein kinase